MPALVSNAELDAIFAQHADMVYRIIRIRIHQEADANDVFQEVFLRLVENAARLHGEAHIKAWLIRVAINCCNKHHTSAWKARTTLCAGERDALSQIKSQPDAANISDENEAVLAAVESLPPHYRDAIHLFYYEDLSVRTISQIMQLSPSNVKTRLSRARDMLKIALKEEYYESV